MAGNVLERSKGTGPRCNVRPPLAVAGSLPLQQAHAQADRQK